MLYVTVYGASSVKIICFVWESWEKTACALLEFGPGVLLFPSAAQHEGYQTPPQLSSSYRIAGTSSRLVCADIWYCGLHIGEEWREEWGGCLLRRKDEKFACGARDGGTQTGRKGRKEEKVRVRSRRDVRVVDVRHKSSPAPR